MIRDRSEHFDSHNAVQFCSKQTWRKRNLTNFKFRCTLPIELKPTDDLNEKAPTTVFTFTFNGVFDGSREQRVISGI
jgi:hypothetical protein